MARVLIPLPDRDFDITEVSVPWAALRQAGHEILFATECGDTRPEGDPLLIDGVLFGKLGAEPEPLDFYRQLLASSEMQSPQPWSEIEPSAFDALLLPGGHAQGMRQYLGSSLLQRKIAEFWRLDRPVAAICHGVLLLARAQDAGQSLIHRRRTTCLPKYLERIAYYSTAWKHGRYYRTYDAYVEDEVRAALLDPKAQFQRGPWTLSARDDADDSSPSFLVEDGNYLSSRWPGDAYTFARRFVELIG